jgi:DNA helicase-2/ATP-dependent DNA helicase PcrA
VLYRVNALGRSLQTAFAKSGIPYRVVGDMGFYDRKEIKDMVAYLSVVGSSTDNLRLKRIINEPKRKIGAATVDALEEIASQMGTSMLDIMERVYEFPVLAKTADKLNSFATMIKAVRDEYKRPSEIINALFERSGYRDMLKAEGFEGEGKIENVGELISAAVEYEHRCEENETEPELLGFLEEISLISDLDKYDENADAVVLMTVHAAKGLEFPVVFLAGMEDGIFPSSQSLGIEEEMSEERRLAYVAITRAKEKLYISYAKSRTMYGKTTYNLLSCFVRNEVPRDLMKRDVPASVPPRAAAFSRTRPQQSPSAYSEFRRAPEISTASVKRGGAQSFGIERFGEGTRVCHDMFGEGVVMSSRDMGGDVLYEVRFDSGVTKKLMATFAKLKKI